MQVILPVSSLAVKTDGRKWNTPETRGQYGRQWQPVGGVGGRGDPEEEEEKK